MDTALIVVGLIAVAMLVIWVFTYMSDPKLIDDDEETQVRSASPEEREHARFEETAKTAESNADDIAFYSPGDSSTD